MSEIKSHKDLEVWKISMDFVTDLYKLTKQFPPSELYGLTSQIKRAAVSIPSNIAEGAARKNTKEFIQFLHIALGSLAEIETQLEISSRLGYIKQPYSLEQKSISIRRLIIGLITSLKKRMTETN